MVELKVSECRRVVVNREGEAWSFSRAFERGIKPDVIFIRNDGWTLGAPSSLEDVAFDLWKKDWTHFARAGKWEVTPIENY